jgi:hypothetical protein
VNPVASLKSRSAKKSYAIDISRVLARQPFFNHAATFEAFTTPE